MQISKLSLASALALAELVFAQIASTVYLPPTQTGAPSWQPSGFGSPLPGLSGFYLGGTECSDNTNVPAPFRNRADWFTQAVTDAQKIAGNVNQWPASGTSASTLYLGKGIADSEYQANISANFLAAERFGTQNRDAKSKITLTCLNEYLGGSCNSLVTGTAGSVVCWQNHTIAGNGWSYSNINCCDPFFTDLSTVDGIYRANKHETTLDMKSMRTSGDILLHSLLESPLITQDRPAVIDQSAAGTDTRIYGTLEVAEAAVSQPNEILATNADSNAVFAAALYWQTRIGTLPLVINTTSASTTADEDFVLDSGNNYIVPVSAPYDPLPLSGKSLRILPLGDSITNGYQSTDGNGYRLQLYNDLVSSNTVQMIGSLHSGNMTENENEGHDGATIAQISGFAKNSLGERPNVVLMHVGTNDMNLGLDVANAPLRAASLIDQVVSACPDAVVLVALIIPAGNDTVNARISTYNLRLNAIIQWKAQQGHKVLAAHMNMALTPKDLIDGLHPLDEGYRKLGNMWSLTLQQANRIGWISEPVAARSGPASAAPPDATGKSALALAANPAKISLGGERSAKFRTAKRSRWTGMLGTYIRISILLFIGAHS
jgi:lysophospholipase L1-like esterase